MRFYSALICLIFILLGCQSRKETPVSTNSTEPAQNFLNSEIVVSTSLHQKQSTTSGRKGKPELLDAKLDRGNNTLAVRYRVTLNVSRSTQVSLQYAINGQHYRNAPAGSLSGDTDIVNSGEYTLKWNYGDLVVNDQSVFRIVVHDEDDVDIGELVKRIDEKIISQDLRRVVGSRNYFDSLSTIKIKEVANYIEQRAGESGFMVRQQKFDNNRIREAGIPKPANIIATLPGIRYPEKSIVIMFHIDTVEKSPGADDNGSGIAAALSMIKVLGDYNYDYTVHFAGVDLEEVGLLGSFVFISEGAFGEDEEVIAGINIDMIGYTSEEPFSQLVPEGFDQVFPEVFKAIEADSRRGNFGIAVANEIATPLNAAIERNSLRYVPDLKMHYLNLPGRGEAFMELRRGDHVHFWDKDIPMVYLGDGADSRNRNYHGTTDVLATVNFDHLTKVTKSVLATVAELAKIKNSQDRAFAVQ